MKKIVLFVLMLLLLLSIAGYSQTPPPANLTATVLTSGHHPAVKLTWEYDSVNTHRKFIIYKKFSSLDDTLAHFFWIWSTERKEYVDNYVRPGATYSYYVTAVKERTESEPSNAVEASVTEPVIHEGIISGVLFEDSTDAVTVRGGVRIIPASNTSDMPRGVDTDSNGFFKMRVKTGTYFLFTSARGYVPEFYDNASTIEGATMITVNENDSLVFIIGLAKIVPPTFYTLSGWVKDVNGAAQRAEVNAFLVNRPHGPEHHDRKLRTFTDSLGNYHLDLRENDTAVIFVMPHARGLLPEYWDNKHRFDEADRIAITGAISDVNVTLDSIPVFENGIAGTVTDSTGENPLRAVVYAYKKINNHIAPTKYFTRTDTATGIYSFQNMEPGSYVLLCISRGYMATFYRTDGTPTRDWRMADSIVVAEDETLVGVDFALRQLHRRNANGVVFGTINASSGERADGVLMLALNGDDEVIGCAVSDLDGSYEIDGLPPGNYSLKSSAIYYNDGKVADIALEDENEVMQVDFEMNPDVVLGVSDNYETPSGFSLNQNYPNPFNPGTIVSFVIGQQSFVSVKVYNILGNEVATLVNGPIAAGEHRVLFNASNLNTGVYYVRLEADNKLISVKKMLLLK